MAQSFKFFTTGVMRTATAQFVTSEVSGHEIEFALDNNLDTYWEPTSVAGQTVELDFGEDVTLSALIVFVNNYTASWTTEGIDVAWSDNGSSWTFFTGSLLFATTLNDFGVGVLAPGFVGTHRYWRLAIFGLVVIPKFGQIFLCTEHEIDTGNIYPELNEKDYAIKKQMGPGGRTLKRIINRIPIETFGRTWLLSGDADRDKLEAIWDDTGGHALPLIMQEEGGDARIVEIVAPQRFNANKIQHQLYRPTITFRTLPYIEDGENF